MYIYIYNGNIVCNFQSLEGKKQTSINIGMDKSIVVYSHKALIYSSEQEQPRATYNMTNL